MSDSAVAAEPLGERDHSGMDEQNTGMVYNVLIVVPEVALWCVSQGMAELYCEQAKYKQLVGAKDGQYKLLAKSKDTRDAERERQLQKLRSLQDVVDKIQTDFPATQEYLGTVSVSLNARLTEQEV